MTNFEEVMYGAMFDELSSIEKEAMSKEAISFASIGQGLRSIGNAGAMALRDPTAAGRLIKGVYQGAGGGLKGVGAVMKTPVGRAAALGGTAALAVPAAAGFAAGRGTAPRQ
jgi:hypothetical protein